MSVILEPMDLLIHPSGEFLAVSPDAALCLNVKTPDTLAVFG